MTLFAGVYSRRVDQPIPDSVCDELTRAISRDQNDQPVNFRDNRFFITKVDVGAFNGRAFHQDDDGSVSVMAGEPILETGDEGRVQDRTRDLGLLHESWKRKDWRVLATARGVFSAVHYQPHAGKLFLVSDKLGVRPLYFWIDEQLVIFATAVRVLESLNAIPKSMDVLGVTEVCGLGYPVDGRTPYAGISLINAAEVVQVDDEGIARQTYWRWDEIVPSTRSEGELLSDLHASFIQAVSLRLGKDKASVAYLSGGLDSRCVVAALIDHNASVHTFNFALPDTQDYIYGNDFAKRSRTIHNAVPKERGDLTPDYSTLMASALSSSAHRVEHPVERPSLIWSGEGGSVALGHVHLSPQIVDLMRDNQPRKAVEAFLLQEHSSVTRRLLTPEISDRLSSSLLDGIHDELTKLGCVDRARSFYLFLMLNDQRRKLANHFENIDLHRLEFQLPFFDSQFFAVIVSVPIEMCLRHQFYVKWLNLFSPVVTSVPWQAYPGHAPCPLPVAQNAAYQWSDAYQSEQASVLKAGLLDQAEQMLHARAFPEKILRKQYFRVATLIYRLGLRDYSYVIQAGWKYFLYWERCGGRYMLPSLGAGSSSSSSETVSNQFDSEPKLRSRAVK